MGLLKRGASDSIMYTDNSGGADFYARVNDPGSVRAQYLVPGLQRGCLLVTGYRQLLLIHIGRGYRPVPLRACQLRAWHYLMLPFPLVGSPQGFPRVGAKSAPRTPTLKP